MLFPNTATNKLAQRLFIDHVCFFIALSLANYCCSTYRGYTITGRHDVEICSDEIHPSVCRSFSRVRRRA